MARAVTGATQGVMQVATSRPQNQTLKPAAMIKATVTISNKLGLHARASAKLTKLAASFRRDVWISAARPARQRQEHHGRDDAGRRPRQRSEVETDGARRAGGDGRDAALIADKFGEGRSRMTCTAARSTA